MATAYDFTQGNTPEDYGNINTPSCYVLRLYGAYLSDTGTSIQLKFLDPGSTVGGMDLVECYIGVTTTGSSYSGTPTQVTFDGGNDGMVITSSNRFSDIVSFNLDSGNDYLISFIVDGEYPDTPRGMGRVPYTPGEVYFWKNTSGVSGCDYGTPPVVTGGATYDPDYICGLELLIAGTSVQGDGLFEVEYDCDAEGVGLVYGGADFDLDTEISATGTAPVAGDSTFQVEYDFDSGGIVAAVGGTSFVLQYDFDSDGDVDYLSTGEFRMWTPKIKASGVVGAVGGSEYSLSINYSGSSNKILGIATFGINDTTISASGTVIAPITGESEYQAVYSFSANGVASVTEALSYNRNSCTFDGGELSAPSAFSDYLSYTRGGSCS